MVGEWREMRAEEGESVDGYDIEKSIEGLDWTTKFWGIVDSTSAVVQQTECPYSTNVLQSTSVLTKLPYLRVS